MAQVRPALSVEVDNLASGRNGAAQAARAAVHAARSAQAPRSGAAHEVNLDEDGDLDVAASKGGRGLVTAAEAEAAADVMDNAGADGFSSDDDGAGVDSYASAQRRLRQGADSVGARATRSTDRAGRPQGNEYADDSESDGDDRYDQHGEMMEEDDDEDAYDEDEDDDLSSSPSIPDENIDFDLVYALHNFVATVEGQATVHKGNSLTLLDDSNSYWWLVRVLRTQEVGYIPAENIETPFERLARLNKHRNVDLTTATDDDHIQVPEKIYTSHLIKQRSMGLKNGGMSAHSGKLSALSRRRDGQPPAHISKENKRLAKRGVQFGPSTYLEHSGNELSSDDEYDDDNMEGGEYDEEVSGEEDEVEGETGEHRQGTAADRMEPDDGMEWDDAEAERIQRQKEAQQEATAQARDRAMLQQRQQQQMQQAQAMAMANGAGVGSSGGSVSSGSPETSRSAMQQQHAMQHAQAVAIGQQQHLQLASQQHSPQQQQQQQFHQGHQVGDSQQGSRDMGPAALAPGHIMHGRKVSNESRASSSSASSLGQGGFLPSQIQASRERSSSDASQSTATQSPDSKSKRSSQRKSKNEEELGSDEKVGKKRSGVFSGLFSRSKDKKERKSGAFGSGSDLDSVQTGRSSEDSLGNRRSFSGPMSPPIFSSGLGKTVQERDRVQQEAYQRHLQNRSSAGSGGGGGLGLATDAATAASMAALHGDHGAARARARPGSLIATPGSAPMLNVLRVFAGDNINSEATFKTVLLNESTQARDLVRQAVQRFRLNPADGHPYVLTVKLTDGEERILAGHEQPLKVFDELSEANADLETPTVPSVKRSSVGSISSIASNLSLNPAIARLGNDFSDDHAVKFFLRIAGGPGARLDDSVNSSVLQSRDAGFSSSGPSYDSSVQSLGSPNPGIGSPATFNNGTLTDSLDATQNARFALRLLIFPSDLPEGLVFDPQTNALIPESTLAERGPAGLVPGEGISQQYREKVLVLPKNTSVAEVIEQGLDRFGIIEGVVDGGDDVEDRTSRRRSRPRVRYGLSVDVRNSEHSLVPNSRVLEAYPTPPVFKDSGFNRRSADGGKRRSVDSAMLLNIMSEIRPEDPVFILRQVSPPHTKSRTSRAHSPTEDVLATKQEQRKQAELTTIASQPSPRIMEEAADAVVGRAPPNGVAAPVGAGAAGAAGIGAATMQPWAQPAGANNMSRQEIIAAQRAAAHERRAAVLGAQRNAEQGVDLLLSDKARIRSSRSLEGGRVRYSYLPQSGEEQDISAIIEDVLRDQDASLAAARNPDLRNQGSEMSLRAPGQPRMTRAAASDMTLNDFESAPSSPMEGASPLSLQDVHFDLRPTPSSSRNNTLNSGSSSDLSVGGTAPLSIGKASRALATPPTTVGSEPSGRDLLEGFVGRSDSSLEDRITQVLSRVNGGADLGPTQTEMTPRTSNRGLISPGSSGRATPTNAKVATTAAGAAAAAGIAGGAMIHGKQGSVGSEPSSSHASLFTGSAGTHQTTATTPIPTSARSVAGSGVGGAGTSSSYGQASSVSGSSVGARGSALLNPKPFVTGDFGLDHLYSIVDAAARKNPRPAHARLAAAMGQTHLAVAGGGTTIKAGTALPPSSPGLVERAKQSYRAQTAGLFSPPAPVIEDKRIRDMYAPLDTRLTFLEDQLDKLLEDAMRAF